MQQLIINHIKNFDLYKTFISGQNFRYKIDNSGVLQVVVKDRILRVKQDKQNLIFYNTCAADYEDIWKPYLALDIDYSPILKQINSDRTMSKALEVGAGIRVLRQDLWEMILCFIISQNNNIKRISKLVNALAENYGEQIGEDEDGPLNAIPTAQKLSCVSKEELRMLGLGYRDSYLLDAAVRIVRGDLNLHEIKSLKMQDARHKLMTIKGVGGKVADCILLFGMERYEVVPHDVWVKRVFTDYYHIKNVDEKKGYALSKRKWGKYAGIAQQFLFYAEREGGLK